MDIRVLGPLEVERDGQLLNLGGTKQRSVLAVLVLNAREVVSTDRLADAVWDGVPPASVDTTLRGYVYGLRKALEPDRLADAVPRILRTTPGGYVFDVPDDSIDARRFEWLVRRGRDRTNVEEAIEDWTHALELWRGEPFQDFAYSQFVQMEAGRLAELQLACLEDLCDAHLKVGAHVSVVSDLEALCTSHPDREGALRLWMLALYRCGRQADALRAYENGRRHLADELGIDPSPELRLLHEQILRQDDELSPVPSDIPPGRHTLTFLLGDVEQSTERLISLGDNYADVLGEHRRILRNALEEHGGRSIRIHGDGTFAAFETATDAADAAVTAQIALAEVDPSSALPVRMGIHTGEATYARGDFVGLAIHAAARVMDAAHGGQVLVSAATRELLGPDVELADVGLHKLKDIPEAVRLYQVVHPDLRHEFPRLRARAARNDNLPHRLTSFVGRDDDLAQIEESFRDARVLTLTGVGGVGKSRLAIEVGHRLAPRYPDGVWFCELAPIGDSEALVHSIAATLGVEQQGGQPLRDSLLGAVAQRRSLLILDNCEHLLDPVARLVEDIVRGGGTSDVLATSREVIGVEGERAIPVRSLSVPIEPTTVPTDATRLFSDRAQAVRPDFTIDEHNAADVSDICVRLDGIPLAIELAAARVTSLSPAQIAKRLDEGFRFLRSGRRAAVDRHRTLHGAIDWSYELLSEAEKVLFDRLSVFAGGFTLEAAEAVCGPGLDIDVADGIASLVAKSMVDADVTGAETRYSLLETMRQYAQDRLAERPDADDVLRTHATYHVNMLDRMDFAHGDTESLIPRVIAELDNVRAAQAWASAAGDLDLVMRVYTGRSPWARPWGIVQQTEVLSWAEDALTMPGAEDHPMYPITLTIAAMGAARKGNAGAGTEMAARVLELIEDPDDLRRTWALNFASWTAGYAGDIDESRRLNEEYLRVARVSGDVAFQAFAASTGSMIESVAGNHAAAVALAESGYALARTCSSAVQGLALYYLGEALLAAGEDIDAALDRLERAVAHLRANHMHFWVGVGLVALASLRARYGDPVEALRMFGGIINRWRQIGNWMRQWVTLHNLVELFGRLELDESATGLLAAAETSATAPAMIGPQGKRLAVLRQNLQKRMGPDAFDAAYERGRSMPDVETVDFAQAEIDRALEGIQTGAAG